MREMFNEKYLQEKYPHHNINFEKNKKIGEGGIGSIFSKIFSFNKKGSKIIKKREFVIKSYDDEVFVEDSLEVYNKFKEIGLPTFNFLKKYSDNQIITQNLSLNNNFCVSPINLNLKNLDARFLMENKIDVILNFESLCKDLEKYSMLLTQNFVLVKSYDVLFFLGDKNSKKIELRVIFGDFDTVELNCKNFDIENQNFKSLFLGLIEFVEEFVSDSKMRDFYIQYLINLAHKKGVYLE